MFSYMTSYMFLSYSVSYIMLRLPTPWSRMLGSQVTNTQTLPDPTFLEPYNCSKMTTESDALRISFCHFLLEIMAFYRSIMKDNILWVMHRLILWCLMAVKLKFWAVMVTTTQPLHVNNCYLSVSFYYWEWNEYSKRKKVVNKRALMKNQARRGYSKYDLCMKIFYRNWCLFMTQRNVTWWSHNPMVEWPEIWDMPSTENNKIWIDGLNGVWGGIRLYL